MLLAESVALAGSGCEEVCSILPARQLFTASQRSRHMIRTGRESSLVFFKKDILKKRRTVSTSLPGDLVCLFDVELCVS